MTCIVGVQGEGYAVIGADSVGSNGGDRVVRSDPKVFRNGDYAIAFTTSWRMGQLLRFADLPTPPASMKRSGFEAWDCFMATDFVDGIREIFGKGGFRATENGREEGGYFLVAVCGRLFGIYDDFGVARAPYNAIGAGFEYATGSLFATSRRSPEVRVRAALEAAAHHHGAVQGPFRIVRSDEWA